MSAVLGYGLALAAAVSGWRVFRARSAVRASFALLLCFASTALLLLGLNSSFLAAAALLVLAAEALITAVFVVAFMINPAGLRPAPTLHQPRLAAVAGATAFLVLVLCAFATRFPVPAAWAPESVTAALAQELLSDSLFIFALAGAVILAAAIAVITVAGRRGRYGRAVSIHRRPGERPRHPYRSD